MFPVTGCLLSIDCLHTDTESAIVCSDIVHLPFCQEDEDQTGRLSVAFAAMLGSESIKKTNCLDCISDCFGWVYAHGFMPMT